MSSSGLTDAPPRTRIADGGHARVRWSALLIFAIGCVAGTAALTALQPLLGRTGELVSLPHFGPALGVGLVLLLRRRGPYRFELGAVFSPRLIGLAVLAVAIAATVVLTAMATRDTLAFDRTPVATPPVPLLLCAIGIAVVTALGEETAWRGFLQPQFEQWCGPLPAAVAVGVVWATWWIVSRHGQPGYAAAFAITAIALSVTVRAVLRFAGGHHLLVATAFHAAINVGALLVLPGRGEEALTAWSLAVAAVVVAVVVWAVSGFGSARPRTGLAAVPTPSTPLASHPLSPLSPSSTADLTAGQDWDLGWDWRRASAIRPTDPNDGSATPPTPAPRRSS